MPDFLPDEFRFAHEYCFFLLDQLVEVLKSGEEARIFDIRIQFKNQNDANQIQGLSGKAFIDWLETHDYKDAVYLLYYKQVTAALLSDFLHFVYESLSCSKKGKLTVAYALLRKPFKENLFYLEWLLADPGEFLSRFDSERTTRFSWPQDVSRQRKIEIIRDAMKETRYEHWLSADFLYALRYDKQVQFGLEPLWQKANHLFTSFQSMETERCNFNFVFSNYEARYSQWSQIYSFLPLLLFHGVQVVEALIGKFAERAQAETDIIPLRTNIGMLLWMQSGPWQIELTTFERELQDTIQETDLRCPNCGEPYMVDKQFLEFLYADGGVRCNSCNSVQNPIEF